MKMTKYFERYTKQQNPLTYHREHFCVRITQHPLSDNFAAWRLTMPPDLRSSYVGPALNNTL
jgi:hypothetical protein